MAEKYPVNVLTYLLAPEVPLYVAYQTKHSAVMIPPSRKVQNRVCKDKFHVHHCNVKLRLRFDIHLTFH